MESIVFRILIFIIAVVLFYIGIRLSLSNKSAIITYSTAIFCLIFVFLPDFKRFEGLGFKAELLDKKIEEADQVIKKLREISIPFAEFQIMTLSRMGRWGLSFSDREKNELILKIMKGLKDIGVSDEQLEAIQTEFYLSTIFDIASPIHGFISNYLSNTKGKSYVDLENKLSTLFDYSNINNELPNKIEETIKYTPLLTESEKKDIFKGIKENMDDLRYYVKNKKFRRPEKYLGKDEKN